MKSVSLGVIAAALMLAGCRHKPADPMQACFGALPEPRLGAAISPDGQQGVAWSRGHLVLCDREMLAAPSTLLTNPSPPVVSKPGVRAAAFAMSSWWLAIAPDAGKHARLEALSFGPPTGLDGALEVHDGEHALELGAMEPVRITIEPHALLVAGANGATARVDPATGRLAAPPDAGAELPPLPDRVELQKGELRAFRTPCHVSKMPVTNDGVSVQPRRDSIELRALDPGETTETYFCTDGSRHEFVVHSR